LGTSNNLHLTGRDAYTNGKVEYLTGQPEVWNYQCIIGLEFKPASIEELRVKALNPLLLLEPTHHANLFLYNREAPVHLSVLVLKALQRGEPIDLKQWKTFCKDLGKSRQMGQAESHFRHLVQNFPNLVLTPAAMLATNDVATKQLEELRKILFGFLHDFNDDFQRSKMLWGLEVSRPPWAHISLARPISIAEGKEQAVLADFERIKESFEKSGGVTMTSSRIFVRHCAEYLMQK